MLTVTVSLARLSTGKAPGVRLRDTVPVLDTVIAGLTVALMVVLAVTALATKGEPTAAVTTSALIAATINLLDDTAIYLFDLSFLFCGVILKLIITYMLKFVNIFL